MNKKLIALAVASAVAVPTVSSAEVILYGRINNALDFINQDGGGSSSNVSGVSSRFGIKANADLGNGLEAVGRYEFSTFSDREGDNYVRGVNFTDAETSTGGNGNGGIQDTRLAYAGLKGSFGEVYIGQQWSGFYNKVGTYIDPSYTLAYYLYSSFANGPYRESNAVKYKNSFGPVSIELDGRLSENEPDYYNREKLGGRNGWGAAVAIDIGDVGSVNLAYDEQDGAAGLDDQERSGIAIPLNFGSFDITPSYMKYEQGSDERSVSSLQIGTNIENTRLTLQYLYGDQEGEGGINPDQWVAGVYQNLGGGFKVYLEATAVDTDTGGDDEFERYLAGFRFDF